MSTVVRCNGNMRHSRSILSLFKLEIIRRVRIKWLVGDELSCLKTKSEGHISLEDIVADLISSSELFTFVTLKEQFRPGIN